MTIIDRLRKFLRLMFIRFQGEEYKLFWPSQSEFIRMAARFGAKIVPFGVVGEDDIFQVGIKTSFTQLSASVINYCLKTYTFYCTFLSMKSYLDMITTLQVHTHTLTHILAPRAHRQPTHRHMYLVFLYFYFPFREA